MPFIGYIGSNHRVHRLRHLRGVRRVPAMPTVLSKQQKKNIESDVSSNALGAISTSRDDLQKYVEQVKLEAYLPATGSGSTGNYIKKDYYEAVKAHLEAVKDAAKGGAGGGQGTDPRPRGKLQDPPPLPTRKDGKIAGRAYMVWTAEVEDWTTNAKENSYRETDLYVPLSQKMPPDLKELYIGTHQKGRGYQSLMKFYKDKLGKPAELQGEQDALTFENWIRLTSVKIADGREKWEQLRALALAGGQYKADPDIEYKKFLRQMKLGTTIDANITMELNRREKEPSIREVQNKWDPLAEVFAILKEYEAAFDRSDFNKELSRQQAAKTVAFAGEVEERKSKSQLKKEKKRSRSVDSRPVQDYSSGPSRGGRHDSSEDVGNALAAYEQFHSMQRGTATLGDVENSSAGVSGWAALIAGPGGGKNGGARNRSQSAGRPGGGSKGKGKKGGTGGWKAPCWNGDNCYNPSCDRFHPNGSKRVGLKGGGGGQALFGKGGGKGDGGKGGKPGDWTCGQCGRLIFGRSNASFCSGCGTKKP